ncbi:hypothetical protein QMI71_004583 [Salmonella enterica]|nr:hypothetical protein [Salmonella enterica]
MRGVIRSFRLLAAVFFILFVLDAMTGRHMLDRVANELHRPAAFLKDTKQEIQKGVMQK